MLIQKINALVDKLAKSLLSKGRVFSVRLRARVPTSKPSLYRGINKIESLLPIMRSYAYGDARALYLKEFNLIKQHEMNTELHRTIDPSDITDPYILVCGCSNSQGEGVTMEQTYAHLLSKKLNIPVYNISISGSGCDFISLNIMNWISNFPIEPKLVIIQWSFPSSRFLFSENNHQYLLGPWIVNDNFRHNLWSAKSELKKVYHDNNHRILEISKSSRNSLLSFLDLQNIDRLEFILDDTSFGIPTVYNIVDYGVDGKHPGPETHENISSNLHASIVNNLSINRILRSDVDVT
jgi:hypothetical protein